MNKTDHQSHALPYVDCAPGTYLYSDGCSVRKHGDGTCTLIPYTDTDPLPPHSETDFKPHPDNSSANASRGSSGQ